MELYSTLYRISSVTGWQSWWGNDKRYEAPRKCHS